MNKKMTREEAQTEAQKFSDSILCESVVGEIENGFVVSLVTYDMADEFRIKAFPFEPPRPEIGTTCKFSNSDNDDWCIGQLKNHNLNPTHGNHFQASNGWWYGECIPFDLVDPAEHEALKCKLGAMEIGKRNSEIITKKLRIEFSELGARINRQKSIIKSKEEAIHNIINDRDNLRAEHDRLQGEIIDPEEHAKAKQAEAVLAELLPVCEKVVENLEHCFRVRLPCEMIEALGKLRSLIK